MLRNRRSQYADCHGRLTLSVCEMRRYALRTPENIASFVCVAALVLTGACQDTRYQRFSNYIRSAAAVGRQVGPGIGLSSPGS